MISVQIESTEYITAWQIHLRKSKSDSRHVRRLQRPLSLPALLYGPIAAL